MCVENIMQLEDLLIIFQEHLAIYDPCQRGHRDHDLITEPWREVVTERNSNGSNISFFMLSRVLGY